MEAANEENTEENSGPSVDSNDQEERIEARRMRIQKRLEAAKREALGENISKKQPKDAEQEQRKSSRQIEESFQRLLKLRYDGSELVSNVQVACHAREDIRRNDEDEIKRQRMEKLEAEAKSAVDKFDEVTKKWDLALSKETPQDLHEMLMEQKSACDAMIEEKNRLIDDLQQELKTKDDQYVKDLRKEAEDIDLMVERMEEQVKTLLRAYQEEMSQIEKSFDTERRELMDGNQKRWELLMSQRREKEVDNTVLREKRVDDFENQLQTLRIQDAEEYNMVKIKLETDVQILEQNLQQMKATYQLNQEKLEYNFQVLKKRDEENTITKSQQKRKITRLQDLLNNLKQKAKKQEKQYSDENQSLTDDLKRITEQYKELQKKFRHFQTTDDKKFQDIWLMNEDRAKNLVTGVLKQDEIIFEHQLGLTYKKPDLEFMKNVGPLKTKKTDKKKSAVEMAEEIFSGDTTSTRTSVSHKSTVDPSSTTSSKSTAKRPATVKDVPLDEIHSSAKIKEMLELLCDESGFLVESKLLKLLAPLDKDERSLMKLDAIFNALGIETEEDISLLARSFYHVAPACKSSRGSAVSLEEKEESENEQNVELEEGIEDPTQKELVETLIHPNDVLGVIRKFVEDNREPIREIRRTSFRLGTGPFRDDSQDEEYWKLFGCIVDERLWDALIPGFERYSETLTDRAKLIQTTDALRQQNSELRMLLHQYINSRINQELEIPPTKVLQLDGQ